jgi:hypothetical protein
LIATVVAVVIAAYTIVDPLLRELNITGTADMIIESTFLGVGAGVSLWFIVLAPLRADTARERALTRRRTLELIEDAKRQESTSRVHRAMDMAGTKASAHVAVKRAQIDLEGPDKLARRVCRNLKMEPS